MDDEMKKILEMGGRAAAHLEPTSASEADKVTHQDVLLMVQAALQMARQDQTLHVTEKRLIKRLVTVGHVNQQELTEIQDMAHEDIALMIDRISGRKARKAFLLTIVAVAIADEELDPAEEKMIALLTKRLGVGAIDLKQHNYEEIEGLVLKFVASAKVTR